MPRPALARPTLAALAALAITLAACSSERAAPRDEVAVVRAAAPAPPAPPAAPAFADVGRQNTAVEVASASTTSTAGDASEVAPFTRAALDSAPALDASAALVIRTGTASVEVDSLDAAIARVRALAREVGGWVANASVQSGRDQPHAATLELRVPAAAWERAVTGLRPLGHVEAVNESVEDVGEEFVDVAARLSNARRLEGRLLALLATRTGRLADVVAVEHELAGVREEIERYEGRARFLRARSAVSTLTVRVHEPLPIVARAAGRDPLGNAVRAAWRTFVAVVAAAVAALGWLLPLGAATWAAWWVLSRLAARPRRPDQPRV